MGRKIKVFITTIENMDNEQSVKNNLNKSYNKSDKKYELTANPELADIILVTEARMENREKKIISNRYFLSYPKKCFTITFIDNPVILNHGIYTSCEKSLMGVNRIRAGTYSLYQDEWINPYIKRHLFSNSKTLEKKYLFSFIGRNSALVRKEIFEHKFCREDIFIEDSTWFDLYAKPINMLDMQKRYVDTLTQSKFSLCPRGTGTSSIRLFESMELGIAPVIISDNWIPPKGPKWQLFSVRIKEKDLKEMEKILVSLESSYEEMGNMARNEYERYFSDNKYFNYLVDNCIGIKNHQIIPEKFYMLLNPHYLFIRKLIRNVRRRFRSIY